jgi:clan AA aspartic protease (TIGR02281 family)
MVAARGNAFGAVFVLVAPLFFVASRAQDPAPAESRPDEVLKAHDLKKSGTTWVLSGETTVLKNLRDAREIYKQVAEGTMRQQELDLGVQNHKGLLQQLGEQADVLSQQIAQLDQQLANTVVPPGGNNFVQAQRDQLNRERNVLVAENNRIVNQLNTLREQNPDQGQELKLQLNAEVAQTREKYIEAVLELRKSIEDIQAKYGTLSKDPEITKSLDALSAATKSKHRLGPSKALRDAIALLDKSAKTVQSESINLQRDGGVFHVTATLGKVPARMVFDTGAGLTTIPARLAARIGVKAVPGDAPVRLKTADGTVVEAKQVTIPTVRVGKFSVANVEAAVMPSEKGDVDPLLGQSFFKHFKVEFSPDAGTLSLKRLQVEASEAEAKSLTGTEPSKAGAGGKAATKARRPIRAPRATAKSKRSVRTPKSEVPGGEDPTGNGGGNPNPN